jgi:hypothetical protein
MQAHRSYLRLVLVQAGQIFGMDTRWTFPYVQGNVQATQVHPVVAAAVLCMQVAHLKAWVTDNQLQDEEFFKLCQHQKTRKADWVQYVKGKLASC